MIKEQILIATAVRQFFHSVVGHVLLGWESACAAAAFAEMLMIVEIVLAKDVRM